MKKSFTYLMLVLLTLSLGSFNLLSQKSLQRAVIGSGGVINEKTSANWHVSGINGQLAIEKRSGKLDSKNVSVYQGFWVPVELNTVGVDDPTYITNTNLSSYPNPASSTTTFRYNLPGQSFVTLKVFDVTGNLAKVLVSGLQEQGSQEIYWDLKNESGVLLVSGSYLYELTVSPAQMVGSQAFSSYTIKNVMVVVK